ncbi:MAG: glycosyltransferase [Gammaproteobacteria bacterium]|nr:glycosyltransferase [Gammaproteobacteria bacterium]
MNADPNAGADHGRMYRGPVGDVLLMSMRRRSDLVGYCASYEFEDVIAQVTGADRFEPGAAIDLDMPRRAFKAARYLSGSRTLAWRLAPKPRHPRFERRYELFFPVFTHAHELFALAAIPDWRRQCRVAACFIAEMWLHILPRYLLELLRDFDHVFVGVRSPVEAVAKIARRPCSYLPPAASVLAFSPLPDFPRRVIDVCSVGRRSAQTHRALIELARRREIFYYYDTVAASGVDLKQRTFRVQDAAEHRLLLANLLKRSRYYIANRALVNDPGFTRGSEEISSRFYEGAAAGTVMIGEPPVSDEFTRQFDWEDAIVRLPFDSPEIGALIAQLDRDPARQAKIRCTNFCNAALRHDWLHRLQAVYQACGIAPTAGMAERQRLLAAAAAQAAASWPA